MSKIDELLISALNGAHIDEDSLVEAVDEVLPAILSEKIDFGAKTIDKSDRIAICTPEEDHVKIRTTPDVKRKIQKLLCAATAYVGNNSHAYKIINRVIGDNVKDFAGPMMMLVGEDNAHNEIADIFTEIANGKHINFYNDDDINPKAIGFANDVDCKKLWNLLLYLVSNRSSLQKFNVASYAGGFALGCIFDDLTIDASKLKDKSYPAIPDLCLRSEDKYIEVKNAGKIAHSIEEAKKMRGARITLKGLTDPANKDKVEEMLSKYFSKDGDCILIIAEPKEKDCAIFAICAKGTLIEQIDNEKDAYMINPSIKANDDANNRLFLFFDSKYGCWRIVPYTSNM